MKHSHEYYMNRALALSLRAKGRTSPNPLVGAVVAGGGKVIAEAYHKRAGQGHAERIALDKAGQRARGAQLFVTLEPCAHYGRTPPCVERVIASGVREVIIGMRDPNPLTNGRGIRLLRSRGIKVKVGVLEDKIRKINAPFIKYVTTGMPYVTVKAGESLDGKIAGAGGRRRWITCRDSRVLAHRMRRYYDGIMVGVGTLLADNPRLEAQGAKKPPVKIIVDTHLRTPVRSRIFRGTGKVIIAAASGSGKKEKLYSGKATILKVKKKQGKVDLCDMLRKLARMEITSVLVEGGGTLNGSLFDAGLVDKVIFFIAPKIIGGKNAVSSVMGRGVRDLSRAVGLDSVEVRRVGVDILVEALVKRSGPKAGK